MQLRAGLAAICAAAVFACSSDSPATGPEPAGVLPVAIAGTVRDSLTGRPIPDALVTTSFAHALTGADGGFTVLAPPGRVRIHVAHPQYSLKSVERFAGAGANVALEIAPLGPTVLGCEVRQGVMWLLVTDLQGRKTVVRRDSSGVTLGDGPARRWVVAHDFTWWALDELHWLVDGPAASSDEVVTAEWRLFDTDGNVRRHGCGTATVPVRAVADPPGGEAVRRR